MNTLTATLAPDTLPVSVIERSPTNPREYFDPEKEQQMAETLRPPPAGVGFLQPLLLRPWPGRDGVYELVDGERRWRAAKSIGIDVVPVTVRELTDAEVVAIQLVAGETSEPLTEFEEAKGIAAALKMTGADGALLYDQESLARSIGQKASYVSRRLKLLQAPSSVRAACAAGVLPLKVAERIAAIPDSADREEAARAILPSGQRSHALGFDEAYELIRERWSVGLRGAPFALDDATFDGPDGKPAACKGCVYAEAYVCTRPRCFRGKCELAWERAAAKAKAAGQRVLTDEEAATVFEKNSPTVQIAFSSPYVDVSAKPTYRHVANEVEDQNLPTWRELIEDAATKKGIKVPVVLARDRTGKQWELVQLTLAIEAARAIGEDMFRKAPVDESLSSKDRFDRDSVRSTVRSTDSFEQRKQEEQDATKKRLAESCLGLVKLHDALSLKILGNEEITDALLPTALHHAGADGQALFVKAFGLPTTGGDFEHRDAIELWFRKRSKSDRHAAIAVLLVAPSMKWNGLKCEGFVALAASVKLDVAAIEKEAGEMLRGKATAKAAKAKTAAAAAQQPNAERPTLNAERRSKGTKPKPQKPSPAEIEAKVRQLRAQGKGLVDIYLATHIPQRKVKALLKKIDAERKGVKK